MDPMAHLRSIFQTELTTSAMRETEAQIDLATVARQGAMLAEAEAQLKASRLRAARHANSEQAETIERLTKESFEWKALVDARDAALAASEAAVQEWRLSQMAFRSLYHEFSTERGMSVEERDTLYKKRVVELGEANPAFQETPSFRTFKAEATTPTARAENSPDIEA